MANRSLFPDNVKVAGRQLQQESAYRSGEVKDVASAAADFGVVSGLVVTVNGTNNQTIDVATGVAYSPRGDRMTKGSSSTGLSITNTLGTKNYVLVVYDELQSQAESHESAGTTLNTRATEASRVVVLTESVYNALPQTDLNLGRNDKDRAALVAIVTGTGGALSSTNIQNATSYPQSLTASATGIAGVAILQVGQDVPTGTGAITLAVGPTTLAWRSPGDGVAGTPVSISSTGTYTLTSSSVGSITVSVTYSQLPLVGSTNSVTISTIYTEAVRRFTAVDDRHRSLLGSGLPSAINPHGMTLDDLSPGAAGTLEQHQDVMHTNGIVKGSSTNFLSVVVNTGVAPDSVTVGAASPGDVVYINGRRIQAISGSNTITFGDGTSQAGLYGIYLSQDGVVFKQQVARYPNVPTLLTQIQLSRISGVPAGSYNLKIDSGLLTNTIFFGGDDSTSSTIDPAIVASTRIYNADRLGYIDVYANLTPTDGTDSITVLAPPDPSDNLLLAFVFWSGSATGFLGNGFSGANAPNIVHDERVYGTIGSRNTNDEAGIPDTTSMFRMLGLHGAFLKRNLYHSQTLGYSQGSGSGKEDRGHYIEATGLNLAYNGGCYAINGILRYQAADTAILPPSVTSYKLYLDIAGIKYSTSSWQEIESDYAPNAVVRLYELNTDATDLTASKMVGKWIDGTHDAPGGVVSIDATGRVFITSSGSGPTSGLSSDPLVTIGTSQTSIDGLKIRTRLTKALDLNNTGPYLSGTQLVTMSATGQILNMTGRSEPAYPAIVLQDSGLSTGEIISIISSTSNSITASLTTGASIALQLINNSSVAATLNLLNSDASGNALALNATRHIQTSAAYDFKWNVSRTRNKFIGAAAMINDQSAGAGPQFNDNVVAGAPYWSDVIGGRLCGQIQLPANAVITAVSVVYETATASPSASCIFTLNKTDTTFSATTIHANTATWAASLGVRTELSLGAVAAYTPIDGLSNVGTYSFVLEWPTSGTANIFIYGFKFTFTYGSVTGLEL